MEKEINNFDFEALLSDLLATLTEREREVLIKRYQLTLGVKEPNTLKEIGDVYGITRERVRQIEREAIDKLITALKELEQKERLNLIVAKVVQFLERHGGVVSEADLIANHIAPEHDFRSFALPAFLFVLNRLVHEVERIAEDDNYHAYWKLKSSDKKLIQNIVDKIEAHFAKVKAVISDAELFDIIEKEILDDTEKKYLNNFLADHPDLAFSHLLRALLAITKKIEKNILDHWGISHWADVKPNKLADKIQLVFRKSGKPLHFREVSEMIGGANFDRKNICAATVHNELIANKNYVLIGRGLYAMKDWGYAEGTVADVIERLLAERGALSKEEIYRAVLAERKVNPSTIYLSLINKNRFRKLPSGAYDVKK
jgi:hypothetical protein